MPAPAPELSGQTVVLDRQGWGLAFRDARLASDPAEGDVAVSITLDARRKGSTVATR